MKFQWRKKVIYIQKHHITMYFLSNGSFFLNVSIKSPTSQRTKMLWTQETNLFISFIVKSSVNVVISLQEKNKINTLLIHFFTNLYNRPFLQLILLYLILTSYPSGIVLISIPYKLYRSLLLVNSIYI